MFRAAIAAVRSLLQRHTHTGVDGSQQISGAAFTTATWAGTADIADVSTAEATGSATSVPRGDHVHTLGTGLYGGTPVPVSTTNSAGTGTAGTKVAPFDHQHTIATGMYGTPVSVAAANSAGTTTAGTQVASFNHVHTIGSGIVTSDMIANGTIALADLASSVYGDTSFTPTLAGDSTAGTQTYSQQVGNYFRVGGFVVVFFNIVMTAKDGTTAGNIYISMPVTSRNTTNLIGGGFPLLYNLVDLAAGQSQLGFYILPNDTKLYLSQGGDNSAAANVLAAAISATTYIRGVAAYPV